MDGQVWSLARGPLIRERASCGLPDWEAAIAGNSALREAHVRALGEELFTTLAAAHGHALYDIQSFNDEVERPVLDDSAIRCSFPPAMLGQELQT